MVQLIISARSVLLRQYLVNDNSNYIKLITNIYTLFIFSESKSDTCATDTFRVEPTQGLLEAHITHISDSKILLCVYFTAK